MIRALVDVVVGSFLVLEIFGRNLRGAIVKVTASDLKVINACSLLVVKIDPKIIVAAAHSSVGGSGIANVERERKERHVAKNSIRDIVRSDRIDVLLNGGSSIAC